MESKIEKKSFGIAEFKEEEKWLEEQNKDGWRLIKTNRNKYQFERSDSGEWIYQIDFKENGVAPWIGIGLYVATFFSGLNNLDVPTILGYEYNE